MVKDYWKLIKLQITLQIFVCNFPSLFFSLVKDNTLSQAGFILYILYIW